MRHDLSSVFSIMKEQCIISGPVRIIPWVHYSRPINGVSESPQGEVGGAEAVDGSGREIGEVTLASLCFPDNKRLIIILNHQCQWVVIHLFLSPPPRLLFCLALKKA